MDGMHSIVPSTILKPHPNSSCPSQSTEINKISYDPNLERLYDAAGDLFGSYIWDINTSALSGTLGGNFVNNSKETNRKGHLDYLHTIKTVPGSTLVLSGGEDGQVGIWDGKQETLVEMIQDPSTIKKMNTQFKSNGTLIPSQHASARWVSSIDVDEQGNWAAFGGGIEHETATRMSPTRGGVWEWLCIHLEFKNSSSVEPSIRSKIISQIDKKGRRIDTQTVVLTHTPSSS